MESLCRRIVDLLKDCKLSGMLKSVIVGSKTLENSMLHPGMEGVVEQGVGSSMV